MHKHTYIHTSVPRGHTGTSHRMHHGTNSCAKETPYSHTGISCRCTSMADIVPFVTMNIPFSTAAIEIGARVDPVTRKVDSDSDSDSDSESKRYVALCIDVIPIDVNLSPLDVDVDGDATESLDVDVDVDVDGDATDSLDADVDVYLPPLDVDVDGDATERFAAIGTDAHELLDALTANLSKPSSDLTRV
jgi:hypothetical protein